MGSPPSYSIQKINIVEALIIIPQFCRIYNQTYDGPKAFCFSVFVGIIIFFFVVNGILSENQQYYIICRNNDQRKSKIANVSQIFATY